MRTLAGSAALALLALTLAGCNDISDALSVGPEDLIELTASASSVPADGATRVLITARVPAAGYENQRALLFATDVGGFVGALNLCDPDEDPECNPTFPGTLIEVTADLNGLATVQFQAPPTEGRALVQAEADSYAQTVSIQLQRVPPQHIDVAPGDTELFALDSTLVTAWLRRSPGVATANTRVTFLAQDAFERPLGFFQDVTPSDVFGRATAVYSPGDTGYHGRAVIIVRYQDQDSGEIIEGRAEVEIID